MIEQLGIVATGVVAVWLTQDPRETWRRWACLFGLAGQPFWIWAAAKSGQWGILAISLLYTWAWARGVWVNWLAVPGGRLPAGESPGATTKGPRA
jgi:hypothetical protein